MSELPDVETFKHVLTANGPRKTIERVVVSDKRILGKLARDARRLTQVKRLPKNSDNRKIFSGTGKRLTANLTMRPAAPGPVASILWKEENHGFVGAPGAGSPIAVRAGFRVTPRVQIDLPVAFDPNENARAFIAGVGYSFRIIDGLF